MVSHCDKQWPLNTDSVQGGRQWLSIELQSGSLLVVAGERPLDGTALNVCAPVGFEEAGSAHEAKAFFRAERGGWSSPPETSYPVRVILCHCLCD